MKKKIAEIEKIVKPVLHAYGVKAASVVGSVTARNIPTKAIFEDIHS
jgi:hypothetical protein